MISLLKKMWTSLILVLLFMMPSSPAECAKLQVESIFGQNDQTYVDLDVGFAPSNIGALSWTWDSGVRWFPAQGVSRVSFAGQGRVDTPRGWDKLSLGYISYSYPDSPAERWNLGLEGRESTPAWWNQGDKGYWRWKVKGEAKNYWSSPGSNYVSGEWSLYSESAQPLITRPSGDRFWSGAFFDYAVDRALEDEEWFFDGWLLGELVEDEDYQPAWAASEDDISTKLIAKLSGGWSNHYNRPQYTWQAKGYEAQWQQDIGKLSSYKVGTRSYEKGYPSSLDKNYSSREHMVRWVTYSLGPRLEVGGEYQITRCLDGSGDEKFTLWGETRWKKKNRHSLGLKGDLTRENGSGERDSAVQSTYSLDFAGEIYSGYLHLGVRQDTSVADKESQTKARCSLKLVRELAPSLEANFRLEGSRTWESGGYDDDWGAKAGLVKSF